MNNCEICNGLLTHRKSTSENPYHYTESGLPNVFIVGIDVYICAKCEYEIADIPKINELHLMLAKELLLKPVATTGQEFRFLRKETKMGPKEFAERIGVDTKTILNWEKSKYLNRQNDLTVRFLVATELLAGKELQVVISRIGDLTESSWVEIEEQTETLARWSERDIRTLVHTNVSLGIASWDFEPMAA